MTMNRLRTIKAMIGAACLWAIFPATLFPATLFPAALFPAAMFPAALFPAALFAQEAPQSPPGETAKLAAVLTSRAPVFDKAKACQRLSIIGDESAVPALARLLADEKLSNYARCALEGIPGPAPDTALREALSRLQGARLIGVLGSIGVRRDAKAIDAVARLLESDDRPIATAAARALGQIGIPRSADILQEALSKAAPELRPTVANACLICAQNLAKQGETGKAVALCDVVQNADLPEHITLAATYNAILTLGKDGLPRLAALLDSDEEARFRLALQAARRLDVDASAQLVDRFENQSPARRALLLIALGDLGNKASLPTVVEAAKSGEPEVRVEAIRALAQLGDATVVPVLLEAATQSDERLAGAARSTLAVLKSDEINAAITEMLESGDAGRILPAIGIASKRRIASATPALLQLAKDKDAATRQAAIRALGRTAALENLPGLIDLAVDSIGSDDFPTVGAAMKSACVRMPQEDCAEKLATAMTGAPTAARVFLLEQLAVVGGTKALETVVAAAKSNDDAMQDAATRLLGEWLAADAAPAMLDLAKTLTNNKYKIRALRGYIRIARQLSMTTDERMEVCRNALAIADRNDEKALVLEVLRRYPAPAGLQMARSMLENEDLEEAARATITSIGKAIGVP